MLPIKLKATALDGSEEELVEFSIEELEIGQLTAFLSNVNRLATARIIESGLPVMEKFKWDEEKGFGFEFTDFDRRDIPELLHLARPLFLSREPASFEKTCAVFGKLGKGTAMSKHLKALRNLYEKGEYQPYFQIHIGDTPLFHNETVQKWLNGVEYHQDPEKKEVVTELEEVLSEETTRGLFLVQLSGRIKAVFELAHLAKLIAEKANA